MWFALKKRANNLSHSLLTLIHVAKCPKGLSCVEKQTAKHFLKWKKSKNLAISGKLYNDYFHFNNDLLKMHFSTCFSTFCEPIQKVRIKTWFLKEAACSEAVHTSPPCHNFLLFAFFWSYFRVSSFCSTVELFRIQH